MGKLKDRVNLEIADLKEATKVIVENHYLHRGRTMAQLPYWILLDRKRVGVILFSYPRLSRPIDGCGPMNVLELARLWISSEVQGRKTTDSEGGEHTFSIGSCAVGKALRKVREDWRKKYPHLPDVRTIVAWADITRHEGTIYKAANFKEAGISGGTMHGNAVRWNKGRDQLNPDYVNLKKRYLFVFPKSLPHIPERKEFQLSLFETGDGMVPDRLDAEVASF
jgi:hypothetical protein